MAGAVSVLMCFDCRSGHRCGDRKAGSLVRKRQQRLALRAGETTTGVLTEKEEHKREDQTEADGKGERNDGHRVRGFARGRWCERTPAYRPLKKASPRTLRMPAHFL